MIQTMAVGTGAEGKGLALGFARAGAQVRIGSRTLDRAQASSSQQIIETAGGGKVKGFQNASAVREAEVIVLTVPRDAPIETLKSVRFALRPGAILVDATVRLNAVENSALITAEHVLEGLRVVSVFTH